MEWIMPDFKMFPLPVRDVLSADADDEKVFSGLLEEDE